MMSLFAQEAFLKALQFTVYSVTGTDVGRLADAFAIGNLCAFTERTGAVICSNI